jgi:hypothetical protein
MLFPTDPPHVPAPQHTATAARPTVGSAVLRVLLEHAGRYRGTGVGAEGEPITCDLSLLPVVGSAGLLLRFRAHRRDGVCTHEEHTLIGPTPAGRLGLWILSAPAAAVRAHLLRRRRGRGEHRDFLFAYGRGGDSTGFREEISLALDGPSKLQYTQRWGMPGSGLSERARVALSRVD